MDWGVGLALLGHDAHVKATYAGLLTSVDRPEVFVDIGANIGTHLVLFAVHDVAVAAFEPNSESRAYLRALCAANDRQPRVEAVALGDASGTVTLHYPRGETWLGSTDDAVIERLRSKGPLVSEEVPLRRLDDFLPTLPAGRMLVKIDTEGHELSVLRGAAAVLRQRRPLVVFECWRDTHRGVLFDTLAGFAYGIMPLPWRNGDRTQLSRARFAESPMENFIAVPDEHGAGQRSATS